MALGDIKVISDQSELDGHYTVARISTKNIICSLKRNRIEELPSCLWHPYRRGEKKTCFLFDDFTDFKFMSREQDTNTPAGSKEI